MIYDIGQQGNAPLLIGGNLKVGASSLPARYHLIRSTYSIASEEFGKKVLIKLSNQIILSLKPSIFLFIFTS